MAFFGFSLLSCHFWPFTGVLRKIFGSLTQEVWEFFGETPEYPLRPTATAGRQRMSRIQRWVLTQKEAKTAKTPFSSAEREPLSSLLASISGGRPRKTDF